MRELRQSTAVDLPIGPFVDAGDGVTAETTLTLTQPDIRLKKNAAGWAQKNAAQTLSHEENGFYEVSLDATDTDTLGQMRLAVFESGAAPVWEDFAVIPPEVWDAKYAVLTGPYPRLGILDSGTAQSATGTTVVLRAAAAFADDTIIGATIMVLGSTQGYWQARVITDAVLATDTVTVDTWTVTPSGTITYVIFASAPSSATLLPAVNTTQFAGQTVTAAAGVTLPSSVASPTNITGGTITTVTNLTNAPTNGDLTATMKTSVTTAATAATPTAAAVTGAVGSVTTVSDKTGYRLSATGVDDILDEVVEGTFSVRQYLRLIASALLAKLSGAATTTVTVRDTADAKDRITATVDSDGNRSAVTLDGT